MADKITNNDIYVKKEENNLVIIDPNKVFGPGGASQDRYVDQEELMYFVNLEANIVPRSILDLGDSTDTSDTRRMIASGTLNYLGPNGGDPLSSIWTDDFVGGANDRVVQTDSEGKALTKTNYTGYEEFRNTKLKNQVDSQLFGIKDIQIVTQPDNLKTSLVTIRMVDVRGRALMELGENSIYSTFFHLPLPQFYLTVKGYYGQAITYQLVLASAVKTEFNNDGDYYITATFMSTNQKLLSSISLSEVATAPYLYSYEKRITDANNEVKVTKTTYGVEILKNIYEEYVSKDLISDYFLEKPMTIPHLIGLIDRLDVFLENELFETSDISFFSDLAKYGKDLENFNSAILEWFRLNVNTDAPITITEGEEEVFFRLKSETSTESNPDKIDIVKGDSNQSLKKIIENYVKLLEDNNYFGKGKKISLNSDIGGAKKKTKISYSPISLSRVKLQSFLLNNDDTKFILYKFVDTIFPKIIDDYNREFNSIKEQVENILLEIQKKILGFEPTLENIMGVILANTECFLRVMEMVHKDAYKQKTNKIRRGAVENSEKNDEDTVYPWPLVYHRDAEGNIVEKYPGDESLKSLLKPHLPGVWPEVKFVDEYVKIATLISEQTIDTVLDNSDIAERNTEDIKNNVITPVDVIYNDRLYNERRYSSIVYRIYNRTIYNAITSGFSDGLIKNLGKEDSETALRAIQTLLNNRDRFRINNNISFNTLYNQGYLNSDFLLFLDAQQNLMTESVEKELIDRRGFTRIDITNNNESIINKTFEDSEEIFNKEIKKYELTGFESYPFTDSEWVTNNLQVKTNIFNRGLSTQYDKNFGYLVSKGDQDLILKNDRIDNTIKIGGVEVNPLSIPKYSTTNSYVSRGYLLLNSIKTKDLTSTYESNGLKENYFARFIGGDIKEISKAQVLKWGSIWYRYKNNLMLSGDILDNVWGNLDITQYSNYTSTSLSHTFEYGDINNLPRIDIGFYPEVIIKTINEIEESDLGVNDIEDLISSGKLVVTKQKTIQVTGQDKTIIGWKSYYKNDDGYHVLPSYLGDDNEITLNEVQSLINNSASLYWSDKNNFINFDDITKPTPSQYFVDEDGVMSYKNIEDLTGLFTKNTLDGFSDLFLEFCKDQNSITSIDESGVGINFEDLHTSILKRPGVKDEDVYGTFVTNEPLEVSTILKEKGFYGTDFYIFDNPYDIDLSTISTFTEYNINTPVTYGEFTTQDNTLFDIINGPVSDTNVDTYRKEFFQLANIDASETNMNKFRRLVNMWGQFRKDNSGNNSVENFKQDINGDVVKIFNKMDNYLRGMFTELNKQVSDAEYKSDIEQTRDTGISGGSELHAAYYRVFKNFNDTWIGGYNWENTNLAEMFRYVNYMNKPIQKDYYLDVKTIRGFYNERNLKVSAKTPNAVTIGSFISKLLKENNLSEPMSFGSNINFYGNLASGGDNITDGKYVAKQVFGTFTDVKKNGKPGFVVFFRSHESEVLKIRRPDFKYKDDSFDPNIDSDNELSKTVMDPYQVSRGNRAISFNVEFGVQNQNMFKDFSITSYDEIKPEEALLVTEDLSRLNNGSPTTTVATNLLDLMKARTYQCTIQMIGNVMIQPFMYFNLRFIPIYSGTYMILKVEHSISPDVGMTTTFTGIRVSKSGIAKVDNPMIRAKKQLLDGLIKRLGNAAKKVKEAPDAPDYPGSTENQGGNTDNTKVKSSPCTLGPKWGNLPYYDVPTQRTVLTASELKGFVTEASNELGFLSQLEKNNLALFAFSVSRREQGKGKGVRFLYDNPFGLHVDGGVFTHAKPNIKAYFCPHTSDGYKRATAMFHNPGNGETINTGIVRAYSSFIMTMYERGNNYFGSGFWNTGNANNPTYLASLWRFWWNTSYGAVKNGTKGMLVTDFINGNRASNGVVKYKNGKTKNVNKDVSSFEGFKRQFNNIS